MIINWISLHPLIRVCQVWFIHSSVFDQQQQKQQQPNNHYNDQHEIVAWICWYSNSCWLKVNLNLFLLHPCDNRNQIKQFKSQDFCLNVFSLYNLDSWNWTKLSSSSTTSSPDSDNDEDDDEHHHLLFIFAVVLFTILFFISYFISCFSFSTW